MKTILYATLAATIAMPTMTHAAAFCGTLDNHYGPFDYRTEKARLPIVENAHFTEEVEKGIRGSSDELGADLDYTLRVFPNHHRALGTLAQVALRDKTLQLVKAKYPVECYFLRAQQFANDDASVRSIYGSYLYRLGKYDKALTVYREAIALEPDSAIINYNIGLAYLKKNDFVHANEHAHKAYEQGYPLPGLRNQLIKAGKWTEIAPASKAPDSAKAD